MQVLDMGGNQISQLPDSVGSMRMLKELSLSGNIITQVSDLLCNLPNLEVRP